MLMDISSSKSRDLSFNAWFSLYATFSQSLHIHWAGFFSGTRQEDMQVISLAREPIRVSGKVVTCLNTK